MLRITDNYTLQTLCGAPHNVWNEETDDMEEGMQMDL